MIRIKSVYSWARRTGFIAVAVGAAVSGVSLSASAADEVRVLFPTPPTTLAIPHYAAIDKGLYEDAGIEVVDTHLADDATALRALLAGNGDVAVVGNSTVYLGIINGAKVKAIGSWQPVVDYQLVTRKGLTDKIGPGLAGLTFAGAGGGNLLNVMYDMLLEKNGLEKNYPNVNIGGHSDRLAAVIAGKADVTLVNTLTATRAGDQVNVLAPVARELGNLGYVYLVVNDKDLADPARRAVLERFMKASILGARYATENPAEAAVALNKRVPELSVELITAIVEKLNEIPVWGVNGGLEPAITEFTAKAFYDYEQIGRSMKAEEIMDRSVIEPALKELGAWKERE